MLRYALCRARAGTAPGTAVSISVTASASEVAIASAIVVTAASVSASAVRSWPQKPISSRAWRARLRHRQRRDPDLVEEPLKRMLAGIDFGLFGRLLGIPGQQPLIKPRLRRQDGLVAEQHVEKPEMRHITAEHDETHGQRRRQQQ